MPAIIGPDRKAVKTRRAVTCLFSNVAAVTGLIALLLVLSLLTPTSVHAAALSPWVQGVIDRANEGMAGGVASLGSCPGDALEKERVQDDMIATTYDVLRPYIDVRRELAQQSQMIRQRTVCFQSDINELERTLNEIRQKMDASISECNGASMSVLMSTFTFTSQAAISLLRGGTDPSFQDDRLTYRYSFHDRGLRDAGVEKEKIDDDSIPICPYTTDYSPHSVAFLPGSDVMSYGCDLTVMDRITHPVDRIEADAATYFMEETDRFAGSIGDLVNQYINSIDFVLRVLRNGTGMPSDPPFTGLLQHGVASGCLKPALPFVPNIDPTVEQLSGNYSPLAGLRDTLDLVLDQYPDYFTTPGGGEFELFPDVWVRSYAEEGKALPIGMLTWPAYDHFSVYSNPVMMIRNFVDRRGEIGAARPLPSRLTASPEMDFFRYLYEGAQLGNEYRVIAENIDLERGMVDAASRDSLERMKNAFSPLSSAVNQFTLATEKSVPTYIKKLTYFLARQCVDGHCKQTLDSVAKRINNEYCTPYTDKRNLYKEDKMYAKCFCIPKDDANPDGLDIGGVDKEFYEDNCLGIPKQADEDKWANLEPTLIPACQPNGTDLP